MNDNHPPSTMKLNRSLPDRIIFAVDDDETVIANCFFKSERIVDWSSGTTTIDGIPLGGGEKYYQFCLVNFCAHNDCADKCDPKPMHRIEVIDPWCIRGRTDHVAAI